MLVIRLFRVGKKNQPSFKVVVTDKRKSTRAGRFVEQVGFWNPITKEKSLKQDRIKYWLSVGVKPSATVHNMLVSEKIIEAKKIPLHKKPKTKDKATSSPQKVEKTSETEEIKKNQQEIAK
jgi:small subunit ribosomal protein S16